MFKLQHTLEKRQPQILFSARYNCESFSFFLVSGDCYKTKNDKKNELMTMVFALYILCLDPDLMIRFISWRLYSTKIPTLD